MDAALLPKEQIKPQPRYLAELGNGETSSVGYTQMIVLADRRCFLNLEAELRSDKGINKVRVRRADDGSFHVVVPSDITYAPGKLPAPPHAKLEPVASIAIGPPEGFWPSALTKNDPLVLG
jgi:hypothetical protein